MDKMNMHTKNKAEENYKKLAELFPNAVTETIDPTTGEVLRAIDKDVLMQEINTKVVEGSGGLYINTTGIGVIPCGRDVSAANCSVGDAVILSGTLGDHHAEWESKTTFQATAPFFRIFRMHFLKQE